MVPTESSLLSGLKATIVSVTNGTAGSQPTVTFTLTNTAGAGVPISALGSISLTMAGPDDRLWLYEFQEAGTSATPGLRHGKRDLGYLQCGRNLHLHILRIRCPPALPEPTRSASKRGGRRQFFPASRISKAWNTRAANPVRYFSVDGSSVAPRRLVVALNNCNQCHVTLSLHGTLRNYTMYCVMCHNPSNTDASTRAAATVAADKALPPQGINLNLLVHRIHFGPNATADGAKNPYIVVGFGGSHNDFSTTLYPPFSPTGSAGDTRNCSICHTNSSELNLPIGLNQAVDPQGWINPNQAVAGACSGCHTSEVGVLPFPRKHGFAGRILHRVSQLRRGLCGGSGSRAVLKPKGNDDSVRASGFPYFIDCRATLRGPEGRTEDSTSRGAGGKTVHDASHLCGLGGLRGMSRGHCEGFRKEPS